MISLVLSQYLSAVKTHQINDSSSSQESPVKPEDEGMKDLKVIADGEGRHTTQHNDDL